MAKSKEFTVTQNIKPTNMEEILEELGGFGRFQKIALFLILIMEIPTAFLVFGPLVMAKPPDFWLCNNETVPSSEICSCTGNITALDPTESIISEWQLICDRAWVSDACTSLQLSGILIGNLMMGISADWYGRRYCFLYICMQMMFGTILTALAPNPYVYAAARFICGCSFSGFFSIAITYTMEFMTPDWRLFASSIGPFGQGQMLLGLLAYFMKDWRLLILLTSVPNIAAFAVFFFVPESPRWLLRNQKISECTKALDKIARINGRPPIDSSIIEQIAKLERESLEAQNGSKSGSSKPKKFSICDFYKNSSNLCRTTLCLQSLWFAWGIVYFGVSFNVRNLHLNYYLSIALLGFVDAVAYPTCLLLHKRLGRLQMLVIFHVLCCACLVAIAVLYLVMDMTGYHVLVGVLAMLGKYGLSSARTPLRCLTGESFPTAIRSLGVGFSGAFASIGAAIAPQLVFLGINWPSVPYFAFAASAVVGCMASAMLKETSGQALADEVQKRRRSSTKLGDSKVILGAATVKE